MHVITSGICYWSKCYLTNSTFPVCFVPDSEITCISVYTAFWIWYKANCKCRICWVTFAPIAYPWGNQFLSEVELVHCETEESTVFQLYLAICKKELFFCVCWETIYLIMSVLLVTYQKAVSLEELCLERGTAATFGREAWSHDPKVICQIIHF